MPLDFNFELPITSYEIVRGIGVNATEEEDWLVVRGWASDTSVDKLNGKMSENCIIGMVDAVNARLYENKQKAVADDGPVGVDIDHSTHWADQIGFVKKAAARYDIPQELIAQGVTPPVMEVELWIDPEMSHGKDLKRSLKRGAKLGMSIFGKVAPGDAVREVNRSTGKTIEHFKKVDLRKIAITSRPVNENTWLTEVKRSMNGVEMPEEIVGEVVETPAVEVVPEVEVTAETAQETPAETPVEEAQPVEGQEPPASTVETPIASPVEEGTQEEPTAPAPAPTIPPMAAPDYIARSFHDEEMILLRSEIASNVAEVRNVLNPLPDILERAMGTVTELRGLVQGQDEVIRSLSARLDAMEKRPVTFPGQIARSYMEEYPQPEAPKPLGSELNKEQRHEYIKTLVQQGRQAEAMALVAGILPPVQPIIDDPLLPDTGR